MKIIVLNGTSSSGKSSLAVELQRQLPIPFLHVPLDAFLEMQPPTAVAGDFESAGKLVAGMHGAVIELAKAGNHVICDHVLYQEHWRRDFLSRIAAVRGSVFVVGVTCPLAVLEERERKRGDRQLGTAALQFDEVHRGIEYDLVVDTSLALPQELARSLVEAIRTQRPILLDPHP